jgi:Holliday junction resolvase
MMAAKLEAEIDPIKYGAMYQKVKDLDEKVDKIEAQVESLVSFADKAKGMAILASILIPVVTAIVTLLVNKLWG